MFRRRLSLVLILLAATLVLQGVGAVFALREAERQVVRGRIASDIHLGFVQLSATKQRLRSWVTQQKIGAGGELAERDALLQDMKNTLADLARLTEAARQTRLGTTGEAEHLARLEALRVLDVTVRALGASIGQMNVLPPDVPARQGWDALTEVFERTDGRDLRQFITQSIARETTAVERERTAADQALARMQALWIGMALLLALVSLAAMVYFARALRRPLDALVNGAQALRQGQLQHRVALHGQDEFSDVARSMNAMAQALEQHHLREMAQRHELEAEVRERTRALHEANESLQRTDVRRRQLLADISHELRTPTTVIRGEAEITLRGGARSAGEYQEALHRIVDTSRQLGSVIEDLLAMARSDMDSLSMVRQPVDFSLVLADALTQAAALAAANQIRIEGPDEELKPVWLLGDAQRLRQLLLLILDNAVCYSFAQGLVKVSMHATGGASPHVELHVKDEGIGIAPDELPRVFERHYRGGAARVHRAGGIGLGLSIAQALAQAHSGSLSLHSPASAKGHKGTCVVLRLPLMKIAVPADQP
ncbi:MAG: ATP-binding protein [Hydrogenophaga sp.]|uniref:sensor histidine kinase n=1 Tax=Hydrogenophaga sp. TaxID=1904254 RepID=UPI002ABA9837|nr:ATP-binding protein [Hydrogenophaga sp.]MDZ4189437.1 ATP-binding protein [Hydrogenophaga sp.]